MALVEVNKEFVNDPQAFQALKDTFTLCEEIPYEGPRELEVKTFRIKGQGVPNSDKYVKVTFGRTFNGPTRVLGWEPVEK